MFPAFIASQFKRPRGLFGYVVSNMMKKGNQKNYIRLIKDLDVQPGEKLLEIGYGPGIGIQMITSSCVSCTVHGIDFSGLMYKKAGKLNKLLIEQGRVQLQYGDFLKIPIDKNQYDRIFCLNVIYFWDELDKPLEKTLSLLKEGGAFYIYMVNPEFLVDRKAPDTIFNKYSIDQVVGALRSAGFRKIDHYFKGGYYIKAGK